MRFHEQRAAHSYPRRGLPSVAKNAWSLSSESTTRRATFRDLDDAYWVAFAERLLGWVEGLAGNLEAGEERLRVSLTIAQQHKLPVMIASGLYSFAYLALARGQYQRAVRMMGATDALREVVGEAPQEEVAIMGDVRGLASAFLDEVTANRVYGEGRAMELEEAVEYALQPERA